LCAKQSNDKLDYVKVSRACRWSWRAGGRDGMGDGDGDGDGDGAGNPIQKRGVYLAGSVAL